MSPPSSSSCMSVVSVDANCSNNNPQANPSKKKRKIMSPPSASLLQASPMLRFVNMSDLVSDLIFPFFDLPTHMIAGRVCSALLKVAGLYIPFLHKKTSVGALSRPVKLPDSITNDQFRRFCVIASPVAIDLFFCLKLTGDCFVHLKCMKTVLRKLNITHCQQITDASVIHLNHLSSLDTLSLSGTGITDNALINLKNMPLLTLNVSDCRGITGTGLVHLKHLQELYLGGTSVSDDKLLYLKDMPLHTLGLSRCNGLTGTGFVHLKGLPLQELFLWKTAVSDNVLLHLKGLPLRVLNLNTCVNITATGLKYLQDLPHLQTLHFRGCLITDVGRKHVRHIANVFFTDYGRPV